MIYYPSTNKPSKPPPPNIILLMQDNRFTYSPAIDTTSFRGPLSFQEIHNRTLASQQPSFEVPKWTPPPTFPAAHPPLYTSTPSQFVASLPPNRQVTFGQGTQGTSEPVRITFNQNSSTSAFLPNYYNPPQQSLPVPEPKKADPPAPTLNSGVNTFVVDTNDFKYVKESQFTGCFHCFSPVTYSTKPKKGLCG